MVQQQQQQRRRWQQQQRRLLDVGGATVRPSPAVAQGEGGSTDAAFTTTKIHKVVGFSQTTLLIFDWLLTWWQNMQMSCLLIDRYVADLAVICLPFDQLFWGNKNGRHTQSLIGK